MRGLQAILLLIGAGFSILATAGPVVKVHRKVNPVPSLLTTAADIAAGAPKIPPHMLYYGGPLIANVKIVSVFWSGNIDPIVKDQIGDFYATLVNSPYLDWLKEYNTSQSIGRGTFAGNYTITPTHSQAQLTDADVQAELEAQIASGILPRADSNTLYMFHFPAGVSITEREPDGTTSTSCHDYCAYHGTMNSAHAVGGLAYYGVAPDFSGECTTGCGAGKTNFDNLTSAVSHEIIESITDAAVGLATSTGAPMAWYDDNNGEIGDMCTSFNGSLPGANGRTYTVQAGWSNAHNSCITGF